MGIGTFGGSSNTPQQVGINAEWQAVEPGWEHTVALRTDGTLWAWGGNDFGQLGIGSNTRTNTPQQVGTDTNWQAVAAGAWHTMALRTDGTLWAWGNNHSGQLGLGTFATDAPYGTNKPQQVGTNADWRAITGGEKYNAALRTGGTLWSWGLKETLI